MLHFSIILLLSFLTNIHAEIYIKSNKFWDSKTDREFIIKGIAYQPRERDIIIDPISDEREEHWQPHLELMKELGMNVIRVYEVNPELSHKKFMKALSENDMYLILDLGDGKDSINREFPSYNMDLLNKFKKRADLFSEYENTFAFFAGNEVMNAVNTTASAPYMKSLIRDLKAFMKTKKRYVPVGYASNDDSEIRIAIRDYLSCGDETSRIDFLGINVYSWCGDSATFESSGFAERTKEYENVDYPVIVSETGCNLVRPRTFKEAYAIYSNPMRKVFSGAIFYELTEESNDYGLIDSRGGSITKLKDFYNLQKAMKSVKFEKDTSVSTRQWYSPNCPSISDTWSAVSTLPPTPNSCVCNTMKSSLSCISILSGENSQALISKNLKIACGLLASYDGKEACKDISQGEGSLGNWGAFSTCSFADQLSYVYNSYYVRTFDSKNSDQTCDFKGTARRVNPKNNINKVKECTNATDAQLPDNKKSFGGPSFEIKMSGFLVGLLSSLLLVVL